MHLILVVTNERAVEIIGDAGTAKAELLDLDGEFALAGNLEHRNIVLVLGSVHHHHVGGRDDSTNDDILGLPPRVFGGRANVNRVVLRSAKRIVKRVRMGDDDYREHLVALLSPHPISP